MTLPQATEDIFRMCVTCDTHPIFEKGLWKQNTLKKPRFYDENQRSPKLHLEKEKYLRDREHGAIRAGRCEVFSRLCKIPSGKKTCECGGPLEQKHNSKGRAYLTCSDGECDLTHAWLDQLPPDSGQPTIQYGDIHSLYPGL